MSNKRIKTWLSGISDPLIRARALRNFNNSLKGKTGAERTRLLNLERPSLYSALDSAFAWIDTPERDDYWRQIHRVFQNEYTESLRSRVVAEATAVS